MKSMNYIDFMTIECGTVFLFDSFLLAVERVKHYNGSWQDRVRVLPSSDSHKQRLYVEWVGRHELAHKIFSKSKRRCCKIHASKLEGTQEQNEE